MDQKRTQPVELPHNWDSRRLRYFADINPDTVTDEFADEDEIEYVEISSVNSRGVIGETETVTFQNAPSRAQRRVKEGDIIVSTVRTYLRAIALVQNPPENLVVSSGFAVIRPHEDILSEYLWYVLQSTPYIEWIVANSEGVSYPAISTSRLSDVVIPKPSLQKQQYVCNKVNAESEPINKYISQANSLLTKLNRKRKTATKRAVLSGINSDENPEDSGVGWIGEVPKHWDVVRTRFVARLESGHTPSKSNNEYWEDVDIPWVSLADSSRLRENDYIEDTEKYTNEKGLANSSAHILPEETVVMTRDATVGLCSIIKRPMAVSQHIVGWVCGPRILPEYLLYVIKSMDQEFDRLTRGSTISTIGMQDIESFKMPLPPIEEQRKIVDQIQTETEQTNGLINKIDETIDLIEEKRQAFITAAVTGQIDITET